MAIAVGSAGLTTLGIAVAQDKTTPPGFENMLTTTLEGVEGKELIISRVELAPNTELPPHWHPGEEIGYVLEGDMILEQKGQGGVIVRAGQIIKIPYKQIHSGASRDDGAKLLVIRVHDKGEPERVPVDRSEMEAQPEEAAEAPAEEAAAD